MQSDLQLIGAVSEEMDGEITAFARPPSDKMVDLHVLIVPASLWRADLRFAYNTICLQSISTGFVRIFPETTLSVLREEIARQLDARVLPRGFVYLRNVGRCFTSVTAKQEASLKAKIFVPPLAPCAEIYILDAKCLSGEVLPPIQKKEQSRRRQPGIPSNMHTLPPEVQSRGQTTAGLAITHMSPLPYVCPTQPATLLTLHHPNPESQGDVHVTTLSHTSPTYQTGYQQQMLVNPYQDDPYDTVGRLTTTSLRSSQGRPSPLQPFLVAESQGDTHSAYGRHLKVATPGVSATHHDTRFQANVSLQYHGPYNNLHSTFTQSPTVPELESSSDSNESQSSSESPEESANPYYGISQKRGLVSPNDPEVIQAAAALEKVLFGDEEDVKQPNKNRGDTAQTGHRTKQVQPKYKLATPNLTGHGQTLPDSPSEGFETESHLQDQMASMKGPQPRHELSNKNTTAVSHSRRVSATERKVSDQKNPAVEAAYFQGQNTPPFQEINSQEVAASLPHSRRGSANALEPLKKPVQTTVTPVAARKSISPVRVEKKARRRTETHPAHLKSRKIFDKKEFESTSHGRRLTSDVHPTINVPTSENVDQQVQNSTTHSMPLPPIGGGGGDESSTQNQTQTSSSPYHRPSTGKANDLLARIRTVKEECKELSSNKVLLATNLRNLQHVLRTKREDADKEWKRRFFQEKKLTSNLEDQIKQAKNDLHVMHGKVDQERGTHLKDSIHASSVAAEAPSEHSNIKIQCRRLELRLQDLKQRMQTTKQRLVAEKEAHRTLIAECRSLRKEVMETKIACTRARGLPVAINS